MIGGEIMTHRPEPDEQGIHIIHDGKFYFSIHEGRHPSWCHVKILQGTAKTLVLLSQPHGYIGTFIATAAEDIATELTNLFGLDPVTTIFVEYTPPTVHTFAIPKGDPSSLNDSIWHALHGVSNEKYERITFQWTSTDTDEPMLKRYSAGDSPFWTCILPGDVAKWCEDLNNKE